MNGKNKSSFQSKQLLLIKEIITNLKNEVLPNNFFTNLHAARILEFVRNKALSSE